MKGITTRPDVKLIDRQREGGRGEGENEKGEQRVGQEQHIRAEELNIRSEGVS